MARRIVALLVFSAILALADPATAGGPPLTFHGDSMGAQARTQITNRLNVAHTATVLARERAVITTMTPGIRRVVERANPPEVVLIELGSGDANEWHSDVRMRQDIRRVLRLVRDVPCVRWLSLKIRGVNGYYQGYVRRADDFNRILTRQAALYPNVRVAPYREWAAANPGAFKPDGLHHTPRGKTSFARFLEGVAGRC